MLDVHFPPPALPAGRQVFLGASLAWYHSGSRIIGDGLATLGTVNLPLVTGRRFDSHVVLGLGGIVMSRHYDPVSNPDNVVIGTAFNAFAAVRAQAGYSLTDRFALVLHGGLTHLSNGAFRLPNIGVNTLHTGIGLRYMTGGLHLATVGEAAGSAGVPRPMSRFFKSARIGAGGFQKRGFVGQSFAIVNAAVFQHIEVVRNFTLSVGPAAEYTNYLPVLRAQNPREVGSPNFRFAVECAMDWYYGRINLRGGVGRYVYKPDSALSRDMLYYRLAANYCFTNTQHGYRGTPYLGIGLKSYKNIAQHPEVVGGILF